MLVISFEQGLTIRKGVLPLALRRKICGGMALISGN